MQGRSPLFKSSTASFTNASALFSRISTSFFMLSLVSYLALLPKLRLYISSSWATYASVIYYSKLFHAAEGFKMKFGFLKFKPPAGFEPATW
ncbi:MAG: hypothetical protein DSO01_07885 [Archaeoglobi archaeon]|nr:MAG: hypothetical protein DSO01_07885 [Archaeoglobi archaeon]